MFKYARLSWPEETIKRSLFITPGEGLATGVSFDALEFKNFIKMGYRNIWFELGVSETSPETLNAYIVGSKSGCQPGRILSKTGIFRGAIGVKAEGISDVEYSIEMRKELSTQLKKEPQSISGLPLTYLLESSINWYEAQSEEVFDGLFLTRSGFPDGKIQKVTSFTFPAGLVNLLNDSETQIGSTIQIIFGAKYGVIPGLGLTFSPILRLTSFGSSTGKAFGFFNYLRPCPPFGCCPSNEPCEDNWFDD